MANKFPNAVPDFFLAPIRVSRSHVTITLPKEVQDEMDLTRESVYCTFVDGVLQVSGTQPNVAIPVLTLNADAFTRQP